MRQLMPSELATFLRTSPEPPLLLDVREPWEFSICQFDNAQLVPMRQIPDLLPTLDPDRPVVVICHHGIRSQQVARYLEHHGLRQVINLRGGIDAWAREVDFSMPTY
ncbi:sulfurtransferase [Rhodoferax sp. 4810]|uniref:Sulfurtransferase n=1 Tax=Thiospirillum jenense TaxID=1653858 RepID=A0A839HFI7_9GAMM|nr:rhodanese-like domain-containing protein [Thiospirillum jenense]MBB1075461.1 sulfurtransferase [Rhodoferax jenense]MBB1126840.1 sulfurtransferase [Thiospirillum jenense]